MTLEILNSISIGVGCFRLNNLEEGQNESTLYRHGYIGDLSVQIKATGTNRGPAFRFTDTRAMHLLFFSLDFDNLKGSVIFNGPEAIALKKLPASWVGQRSLTANQIRIADSDVMDKDRIQMIQRD